MTFLAIIVAVVLLQAWGTADRVHVDGWFASWQARVTDWGLPGWVGLALLVLLPSMLAVFVLDLFATPAIRFAVAASCSTAAALRLWQGRFPGSNGALSWPCIRRRF